MTNKPEWCILVLSITAGKSNLITKMYFVDKSIAFEIEVELVQSKAKDKGVLRQFHSIKNIYLIVLFILSTTAIVLAVYVFHHQAASGSYKKLASLKGIGSAENWLVGPGATPGSQKFYISYQYHNYSLDLVVIDPNSDYAATVYHSPLATEESATGMVIGPDNNVYLGTNTHAHIFKFTPQTSRFIDVGAVPPDPSTNTAQSYVWNLTVSPYDHKIYGCTYPSADLISYDPLDTIPHIINLGTMDAANQYGLSIVADPTYPYIYVGTGSISSKIIAYNIQTHATTILVNTPTAGFGDVWLGADNRAYGLNVRANGNHYYLLSNGTATRTSQSQSGAPTNMFSNGDKITISDTTILITHPNGVQKVYPYAYHGGNLSIFRVGNGPDGNIYAGSILPFYLAKFAPNNSTEGLTNLGQLGHGEPYAMIAYNRRLYIAAYNAPALLSYDPKTAIRPNPYIDPNCEALVNVPNPQCVNATPDDWRPEALISTPDGMLYAGSRGSYGQLAGPLIAWNPQSNTATAYYPFSNQGVASLVVAQHCRGITSTTYCLIGGTNIYGGGGTSPQTSNAVLFLWNPGANAMMEQFSLPNISYIDEITDLVVNPANNYVYGIAHTPFGSYLFTFNPATNTFINKGTFLPFSFSNDIYNSIAIGSDGNIWGIVDNGVFTINLATNEVQLVLASPEKITAGFAFAKDSVHGDKIYFGSCASLYMYRLPFSPSTPRLSKILPLTPPLAFLHLLCLILLLQFLYLNFNCMTEVAKADLAFLKITYQPGVPFHPRLKAL